MAAVNITLYPLLVFVLSLAVLWLAAGTGAWSRRRTRETDADWRDAFGVVEAAALTLLGLIIGFSFSMAISRYDQRKLYEEAEANAIGTEYVRADLLGDADAAKVRELLKTYLDLRVAFYTDRNDGEIDDINARTARLQAQMWVAVRGPALAQPTTVSALVVAGMNDVLNAQGYTQSAWWNRIPDAAWALMFAMAVICNVLVGYGSPMTGGGRKLRLVLPVIISISFFLIADIDSPRHGIIRVNAQNLNALRPLGGP
jgi:hypothetical protein